jgi:hypothetical protein
LAERQEWKRKQGQDADESEAIPDFTGREAGIERLQSWAEIAREVLDAGDDIEAMPLDDVEYHVSAILLIDKRCWTKAFDHCRLMLCTNHLTLLFNTRLRRPNS